MQTYTIPTQYQYTWLTMANTRVMQLAVRIANAPDQDTSAMWLSSYRETLDAIEATFGAEDKNQAVTLFDASLRQAVAERDQQQVTA